MAAQQDRIIGSSLNTFTIFPEIARYMAYPSTDRVNLTATGNLSTKTSRSFSVGIGIGIGVAIALSAITGHGLKNREPPCPSFVSTATMRSSSHLASPIFRGIDCEGCISEFAQSVLQGHAFCNRLRKRRHFPPQRRDRTPKEFRPAKFNPKPNRAPLKTCKDSCPNTTAHLPLRCRLRCRKENTQAS